MANANQISFEIFNALVSLQITFTVELQGYATLADVITDVGGAVINTSVGKMVVFVDGGIRVESNNRQLRAFVQNRLASL